MKICKSIVLAGLVLLVSCASCASRPWTKQEKILLGASCLATVADMTTTVNNLNDGGWEINPVIGKHPDNIRVVATMTATQIITIILAHYFDDFRSWILGTKTGINIGFTFSNTRGH